MPAGTLNQEKLVRHVLGRSALAVESPGTYL